MQYERERLVEEQRGEIREKVDLIEERKRRCIERQREKLVWERKKQRENFLRREARQQVK